MPVETARKIRFGPFELDARTGELRKEGYRVNLHGQPVEVLTILLEQPGELVTREELCKRLWPQDTFVDFEHSLNTAIKKLRQALDDDVETPRYIETLPKKGYRFVAKVEAGGEPADAVEMPPEGKTAEVEIAPRKSKRWLWLVGVFAVLAVAAGIAYRLLRPRVPVVTGIHQLTHTGRQKAMRFGGSVFTDGNRLYFREWSHGRLKVAEMSTKGGEVSYLEIPSFAEPIAWDISADGSELLISELKLAGVDSPVWIFPLPNGPPRRVGDLMVDGAVFVPGSNKLFYSQVSNPTQFFTADLDGNNARPAFSTPGGIADYCVSPDGKKVRFVSNGRWESGLDGSAMRSILPENRQPLHCGGWNPDGRIYGFMSEDPNGGNLWALLEPGWLSHLGHKGASSPVQLTNGPLSFSAPTFSRDGKQIFAYGEAWRGELVVYESASKEFRPYLDGMSAGFLDYSPDGQWVAYVTYPQNVLWRSRVDGTERLQLTFPPMGPALNPKWSPDGKLIAFTEFYSRHQDKNKIEVISANGGSPMLLVAGDFMPADPNWSLDGRFIVYGGASLVGGGETEIRMLDLETKQFTTVPDSQHKFGPKLSPDGRYMAASSDDTAKLFLYSFDTGAWKQLPGTGLSWPMWSRDGRYLYAMQGSAGYGGRVYRYQAPEWRAELVADITGIELACPAFGPRCAWFGLTPDNRVLVLRDRGTEEVYALDLEHR